MRYSWSIKYSPGYSFYNMESFQLFQSCHNIIFILFQSIW